MFNFRPQSLEGTVVGLLFTKTGAEIKEVIKAKIDSLDEDVAKYHSSIQEVDEFLKTKEGELKALGEFYTERQNEKEAKSRPFRRQLEEVHKAWADVEFEFNNETDSLMGEKCHVFSRGFEDFTDKFSAIDEVQKEVEENNSIMLQESCGNVGIGTSSPNRKMMARSCSATLDGMSGVSDAMYRQEVSLPTEQDQAAARLGTLRNMVTTYRQKIGLIKSHISKLESEKEELELIHKHLSDTKEYTLDLDALSSLGF